MQSFIKHGGVLLGIVWHLETDSAASRTEAARVPPKSTGSSGCSAGRAVQARHEGLRLPVPSICTGPITASISCLRYHARSQQYCIRARQIERTVDSIPTVVRPPSSTIATRSPKASLTCCAVVGESSRETIGAGRGDRHAGFANQLLCDGIRGHANPDCIQAGGQPVRHMRLFRQHQRQRPGPKDPSQFFGALRPLAHQAARHFDGADMNNQRTRRRPALGGVDFFDRRWIQRVGA